VSIKSEVIRTLEQHRNMAISGQELADILRVTRAAIGKQLNLYKKMVMVLTPTKEYLLKQNSNILSKEGIQLYLSEPYFNTLILVYEEVTSISDIVKKLVMEGGPSKYYCI
jgi:BirA family biotin operon repressor/biotin-[acetyl-CoA-carboxylase] ligase